LELTCTDAHTQRLLAVDGDGVVPGSDAYRPTVETEAERDGLPR
jgi:hypothetical protein